MGVLELLLEMGDKIGVGGKDSCSLKRRRSSVC